MLLPMTKSIRVVLSILVLAGLLGGVLLHQRTVSRLEAEQAMLREEARKHAALHEEAERLAKAQADSPEIRRLREDQSELLRLRNEVTQLRRQLAESSARRAMAPKEVPSSTPAEQAVAPVQTFAANVNATVAMKQTVAMGGWTTKPGKRTLFFLQPDIDDTAAQAGQVLLKGRFLEIPDDALAQVGLDGLKTENTLTSSHVVLSPEQAETIVKALENTEGVDVLSAPRIQTGHGVQARLSVTDTKTTSSGEKYEIGPAVEVVPEISADRSSVRLTVAAQLRLPNPTSQ